ncbi:MAG: Gfo/Idh/MocA family oxidoreductase, partial [Actinomycetota bacterium]
VHTDYLDLCARSDLDAITIVTPNSEHAEHAVAALASGKHVFCEKPMAINVTQARQMVRAAVMSGKIHQMAFTYRYLYGVQELRRRVRRGDIGVPYHLRAHFNSWEGLQPAFPIGFRGTLALAGGGVLYDMGPHLFDLARFMFGPIQTVSGFSQHIPRQRVGGRIATADIETDDLATAWFTHENGVLGQWVASRVTPSYAGKAHIEVVGHEGALRASLSRGNVDVLRVSTPTRPEWQELPLPEEAQDQLPSCAGIMMRSFVDACLRGKLDGDVDASFYDGLAAQQAIAAVTEATTQLTWVRLE